MAWEPTAVPRELHGQPVHITLEGVPTQRLPNGKIPSESRLLVLARHRAQLDVRQDGPPAAPSLLHPSRPLSPCLELSGLWHVTCHPLLSMASPPSTAMLAYPQKTKVKGDYKTVSLPQQLPLRRLCRKRLPGCRLPRPAVLQVVGGRLLSATGRLEKSRRGP